ncbi:MAG: DUF1588 domain-containing protein [Acidobacteria bacterium]|nr:DUF1588 domain-containing protein [Acidobacteriota bacterium]
MTRSIVTLGMAAISLAAEPLPPGPAGVIRNNCLGCHSAAVGKGGINLQRDAIDWGAPGERALWERALRAVQQERMPPPPLPRPPATDVRTLSAFLEDNLARHTPIGGDIPRRLNAAEYEATIRELFNLPKFRLPMGFPPDIQMHGFDNVAAGLTMSAPLMGAYTNTAWEIADIVFPPPGRQPQKRAWKAPPDDMVISFSASTVRGGVLRMASRAEDIMRSCTWPARVEIVDSGVYRIAVAASQFKPRPGQAMTLEVWAREIDATDRSKIGAFRRLHTMEVTSQSPETFTFEAELYEGQTPLLRWANAELDHTSEQLPALFRERFARDPRLLAAYLHALHNPDGSPRSPARLRGRNGYVLINRLMQDPSLDMTHAVLDSERTQRMLKMIGTTGGLNNLHDTLAHEYFDHGPSLQIHDLVVEGPLAPAEGPKDKQRKQIQRALAGVSPAGVAPAEYARRVLDRFLPRAFRRPVDEATRASFLKIATRHWEQGNSFEQGMHLLLRTVLISPRFLYRGMQPGLLDAYGLAERLAYFLRQGPPDEPLLEAARSGRLLTPDGLRADAERLLPRKPDAPMVRNFTGQWLDTRKLASIMPDPAFNFSDADISMARQELEWFLAELLDKNLPMADFIDPDFTFTSKSFAARNYGYKAAFDDSSGEARRIARLPLERGGRHGGLLGMAATMIATANGVDTQPVLRGVWMLDKILGIPPPAPPNDVPALTPGIGGATTPRELLAAHTKEPRCASCHTTIDPFGFVLENYDPVGRWRDTWPKSKKPIQASVVLPDGTAVRDAVELKRWLVANIDLFSAAFGEKLLTYATGRAPNFAERKEIQSIAADMRRTGGGARDLALALIGSKTFRTR